MDAPLAHGDKMTAMVMAKQLNTMTENMKRGQECIWDIYTEEEKKEDKELEQTE